MTDKETQRLKYLLERSIERTIEDFEYEIRESVEYTNIEYDRYGPPLDKIIINNYDD